MVKQTLYGARLGLICRDTSFQTETRKHNQFIFNLTKQRNYLFARQTVKSFIGCPRGSILSAWCPPPLPLSPSVLYGCDVQMVSGGLLIGSTSYRDTSVFRTAVHRNALFSSVFFRYETLFRLISVDLNRIRSPFPLASKSLL